MCLTSTQSHTTNKQNQPTKPNNHNTTQSKGNARTTQTQPRISRETATLIPVCQAKKYKRQYPIQPLKKKRNTEYKPHCTINRISLCNAPGANGDLRELAGIPREIRTACACLQSLRVRIEALGDRLPRMGNRRRNCTSICAAPFPPSVASVRRISAETPRVKDARVWVNTGRHRNSYKQP